MWDTTYRPRLFADVLGQENSVKVLQARLAGGTGLDTSYMFSGGHGGGKTSLARILARALVCRDLKLGEPCNACDNCVGILTEQSEIFLEQDAASKGTIDNIRGIVDTLPFVVPGAAKRIFLFDEAHRMSRDAQDVLLKPIEEKRMVAILCTTEPEKIRGPIRSRCEEYALRKVSREQVLERMSQVLRHEKVDFEDDAVLTVIDFYAGHIRDIFNRLEMLKHLGPITMPVVREYLNLGLVSTYYQILLTLGDPRQSIPLVESACDRVDPEDVASGLAEAAMNSWRIANGMYADFSQADRDLARRVHEMYGDSLTQLAGYFVSGYREKVALLCAIVRCASGVPQPDGPAAGPIVISVSGVTAQLASRDIGPEPARALSETAAVAAPPTDPPPHVPAPPLPPTPPAAVAKPPGPPAHDPHALTELDFKAIPKTLPRGNAPPAKAPAKVVSGRSNDNLLNWQQWKFEFNEAVDRMFGRRT